MNLKALIATVVIVGIAYIFKILFGIKVAIIVYFLSLMIFIKVNQ